MTALTVLSATTTENNLLYLLFGAQAALFALTALLGGRNLDRLRVSAELPARIFQGGEFPLRLEILNAGRLPTFAARLEGSVGSAALSALAPGERGRVALRERLPWRGWNAIEHLFLASSFPFGLVEFRRPLGPFAALAFPKLREVRSAGEIAPDLEISGLPVAKKGYGDELYGVRVKEPGDDVKFINWKLTAKTTRPMVNEFCASESRRITIRLPGVGRGDAAERMVSEASSAFRYHIDAGSEVRLVTPESELDYGKGLLHLDRALALLALLGEGKLPRGEALAAEARAATPDGRPRLLFLISLIVWGAMFLIDEVSARMLLWLAPALGAGFLLRELDGPSLPQWLWDAVSLAVLLFITTWDWRVSGIAIANTHLIAYLIFNRAMNRVAPAEEGQAFSIYFLGFFLVSGLSISPWYFLAFALYAGAAGAWLAARAGVELAAFQRFSRHAAGVFAAGLALVALVFAVTPRVERLRRMNPFVAMGIDRLQAQSSSNVGFTEDVALGFFGTLKKSTARVMRVKPAPVPASPGTLRLRGAAYDFFDGTRWKKSKVDFRYRMGEKIYWTAGARAWGFRQNGELSFPSRPDPSAPSAEFLFYPMNLSILFTNDGAAKVETPESAYFDFTDTIYFAAPYIGGTRYRVTRGQGLDFSARIEDYGAILKEKFLQLPEPEDPRVAALALRVTRGAAGDAAKARAVEDYLRRNYAYSLRSEARQKTLADFLFASKRGNCEYFATAAAVLLRHAGVPARLITGFLADDWNEYGKFYDVRQGQAHAWTEAYADGRWLTLEPTPASGLVSDFLIGRWERYYEAIEAGWYRHVIGYDQAVQRNTFFRLGRVFSPQALARVLSAFLRALALPAAAVLLLLAGWALKRLCRPRASGFYERAEELLARAGLRRKPHWTAREFALASGVASFRALAELHYRDRYGVAGLSSGERERAGRLLVELSSELRRRIDRFPSKRR